MEDYDVKWKDHSHVAVSLLAGFQRRERFADVTLVCANKTISAHRVVLAACSAYVDRLLDRLGSDHGRTAIVLKDVKPDVMQLAVEFMYSGQVLVPSDKLNDFMELAKSLEIRGLGAFEKAVEATNSKPLPKRKTKDSRKKKESEEEDGDGDEDWKEDGDDDEDFDAPKPKKPKSTPAAKKPPARAAASSANKKASAAKKHDDEWTPSPAPRSTRRSVGTNVEPKPAKGNEVAPKPSVDIRRGARARKPPAKLATKAPGSHELDRMKTEASVAAENASSADYAADSVMVIAEEPARGAVMGGGDDDLEFDALQQFPVDELPSSIPAELSDVQLDELTRMSKYMWRATDANRKVVFFCGECGFASPRKRDAVVHEQNHISGELAASPHLQPIVVYGCDQCGQNFSLKCNLYAHQRTVHGVMSVPTSESAVVVQQGSQVIASSVVGSVGSMVVTAAPDNMTDGTIVI